MKKLAILSVFLLSLVLMLSSIGCANDSEEETFSALVQSAGTVTAEPLTTPEPVVITIGNLTDKTGPSANPLSLIDMALEDTVRYYNEDNLMPGVEFKVIHYDTQLDSSNDIPGYKWLKGHGADIMFTAIPSAAITLKPLLEKDKMVLFSVVPDREAVEPPGYVFSAGTTLCEFHSYTLLEWIAKNDADFPTNRPAKIGGAGFPTSYMESTLRGAKEYAKAHPDQYEWEGEFVSSFKFTWQTEAAALKNCDYIIPPSLMNQFVDECHNSGYEGKFVGTAINLAFFNFIDKDDIWDDIDGMRIIMPNWWWNEDSEVVDLSKDLLERYHPGRSAEIMRTSNGYLTVNTVYIILELVRQTIEKVEPQNFSSQALHDAASNFSLNIDGKETDTFSEEKRLSRNWFAIFEFDADERDLVRLNPDEWLDVIQQP